MRKVFSLIILTILITGCTNQPVVLKNKDKFLEPIKIALGNKRKEIQIKEPSVRILEFGDMMLDRNVKKRIEEFGEDYLLKELLGEKNNFFPDPDITTANLEGTFANYRRETDKKYAFHFDPSLIEMVKRYGFSLFSLGNNHSMDMGSTGLAETKENLDKAGIGYYGNQFVVNEESVLIKEVNEIKIAFLGLNDTNTPINLTKTTELLAKTEADFRIVSIHWGIEYKFLESSQRQQYLAHKLIDAGADIIVGHHPHVIHEMEVYNNRPIFYSLGNFVFDQYFSKNTQQGLGLGLTLEEKRITAQIFPLQSVQSQVKLMEKNESNELMDKFLKESRLGEYNLINNIITFNI